MFRIHTKVLISHKIQTEDHQEILVILFDEIAISGSNISHHRLLEVMSKHYLEANLFGIRHKQSYSTN
jgi:hypothetical protein